MIKLTFWIVYFFESLKDNLKSPGERARNYIIDFLKQMFIPKRFIDAGYDHLNETAIGTAIFCSIVFNAFLIIVGLFLGMIVELAFNDAAAHITFAIYLFLCVIFNGIAFIDTREQGEFCYTTNLHQDPSVYESLQHSYESYYKEWKENKFK